MASYSLNPRNAVSGNLLNTPLLKKYDDKYEKSAEVSFAGVFLFVTPILFTFFSFMSLVQYDGLSTFIQVMAIGGLVVRVIATRWISSLAAEQNRSTSKWMALSFFLPAISLIIIGQTKKLNIAAEVQQAGYAYTGQFQRVAAKEKLQMAS